MKWKPCGLKPPAVPGLYCVFLDGKLAYIGQANSIRQRIGTHGCAASIPFRMFKGRSFRNLSLKYREVSCKKERLDLEFALIQKLRPALNFKSNPENTRGPRPIMANQKINLNFRKFVNELGSQAKAATLMGLSPGHVSLIYNGKRRVTVDLATRIEIATHGRYSKESLVFPVRRKAA